MTRRELLYGAAAAGATTMQAQQSSRPNVVVFLADDLGSADVGYKGAEFETPNIDRLCRDGLKFNRFHSMPLCSPTRSAFMTGRHPVRFGLTYSVVRPWSYYGLSVQEKTIANVFHEAGYQTGCIGKWHLGHTHEKLLPRSRGFDYFYGHMNGSIDYFEHTRDGSPDWQRNGETVRETGYATELLAADAVRWIEARDKTRPFFLYMPWNAPHAPLQAPEALIAKYASITDPKRRTYAAMVDAMDQGIGRVVAALGRGGLMENTIVLFVSDNGGPRGQGANNGSLRAGKGTVFEGGLRVPALLHWKGRVKPGQTDQVSCVTDLLPTLAGAAGIDVTGTKQLDGMNLWPLLISGKTQPREELFFAVQGEGAGTAPKQHALRSGDWKYIQIEKEHYLFNLATDPDEKNNLISSEAARAADLRSRMEKWVALHTKAEVITSSTPHPGWVQPSDWSKAWVR
ncbi:MAG: arylsulfatase [Bryobacteraceae bacterium]|nr:arylsulfatase [Bryobacteraceae bacterium]